MEYFLIAISAPNAAEAWEQSLLAFLGNDILLQDSGHIGGPFLELPNTVLNIDFPLAEPRVSRAYAFPNTLFHFFSPDMNRYREATLVLQRIQRWAGESRVVDQLDYILRLLRGSIGSRRAVMALWNPISDPDEDEAIAPCFAQFRFVDNGLTKGLDLTLILRSCDAWVGAPVDLVAFGSLLEYVSSQLDVQVGRLVYHVVSYHLYQNDVPAVRQALL